MNAVQTLLLSFDEAREGRFESLASALEGLAEEAAGWQPPAFAHEPHDAGVGRPGTVLWHLNHLEHCHRHYRTILAQRPVGVTPGTAPPGELRLAPVLAALADATASLRGEIARLRPEDLDASAMDGMTVARFVAMLTRHLTWHASQVRLTRRLHTHAPLE